MYAITDEISQNFVYLQLKVLNQIQNVSKNLQLFMECAEELKAGRTGIEGTLECA
jgi:hypothetical protein